MNILANIMGDWLSIIFLHRIFARYLDFGTYFHARMVTLQFVLLTTFECQEGVGRIG